MITRRSFLAAAAQPKRPPNIVLLVADDMRPDAISALGHRVVRTPNLDRMVREGTSFPRAVCANPVCVSSRAELISGCTNFRNGAVGGGRIDPALPRFAGTLRKAGYHTWYSGKWHSPGKPSAHGYEESLGLFASGGSKLARKQTDWLGRPITGYGGWVFQTEDGKLFPERGVGLDPDTNIRIADAAAELIERRPSKPFFLHANFTAPHDPLIMPRGFEGRHRAERMPPPPNFLPEHPFDHGNFRGRDETLWTWPRTPAMVREELAYYYTLIEHLDEQVGRVLRAVDANTVVLFTSDNGLAIGSHGLRGKQNMYEHSIGVPLIARGPGVARGKRSAAQVYLRDLFPTACEWAGVDAPRELDGLSLAGVLAGRQRKVRDEVYCYFLDVQRCIRAERWKYIVHPKAPREQLFDLANDPLELRDLSGDARWASVRADLRSRLRAWLRAAGDKLDLPA